MEETIRLQFSSLEEGDILRVCHLELTPEAGEKAILADEEAAQRFRVIPKWFERAGYGLMFHWTSQTQPRTGPQLSYRDAVARFDVFQFAEMVGAAGAGYVIWTVNHAF